MDKNQISISLIIVRKEEKEKQDFFPGFFPPHSTYPPPPRLPKGTHKIISFPHSEISLGQKASPQDICVCPRVYVGHTSHC